MDAAGDGGLRAGCVHGLMGFEHDRENAAWGVVCSRGWVLTYTTARPQIEMSKVSEW